MRSVKIPSHPDNGYPRKEIVLVPRNESPVPLNNLFFQSYTNSTLQNLKADPYENVGVLWLTVRNISVLQVFL